MRFPNAAVCLLVAIATGRVRGLSPSNIVSNKIAGARALGGTDLVVSEACLGTMTWGLQNTQDEAFEQMDYALNECGVNFMDAAELYPVPSTASDWQAGGTETIIGNYLARVGPAKRDEIVVASKIAGYWPASPVATARSEQPTTGSVEDCRLDAKSVKTACEASLRRLQTDRIDLYQVHWPDRYVPIFGQTEFKHDMKRQDSVPIEETAAAMRDLIEEGKVRYIGLSNETPLGVCQWVQACEKLGIRDKLATIQNSYSLIDRRFDGDLAEVCDEYNIGLLSWSILAGGLLSGKYQSKNDINKSRYTLYPDFMSRSSPVSATPQTLRAVEQYNEISQKAGMTPAELAVAFCRSRRFVSDSGSTIVGATTMQQLKENLDAFNRPVELSEDVLEAIDKVHVQCPNPSCSL